MKRALDLFDVMDADDPQSVPSPVKVTTPSKKMRLSFEITEETPVLFADELNSSELSGCFLLSPTTPGESIEKPPATQALRVESPPPPQLTVAPPPSPVQDRYKQYFNFRVVLHYYIVEC